MSPSLLALSKGVKARMVANTPRKLVCTTSSNNSSVKPSKSLAATGFVKPALLTKISQRPARCLTASAAAFKAAVSVIEAVSAKCGPEATLGNVSKSACTFSGSERSMETMRAPKAASLLAVAHPMAPLPPVMTATCPSNLETGSKVIACFQLFLDFLKCFVQGIGGIGKCISPACNTKS